MRTAISESRPSSISGTSQGRSSGSYPMAAPTMWPNRSAIVSPESGLHLAKSAPRLAPAVRLSATNASSASGSGSGVAAAVTSATVPAPTAVGRALCWPPRVTIAS